LFLDIGCSFESFRQRQADRRASILFFAPIPRGAGTGPPPGQARGPVHEGHDAGTGGGCASVMESSLADPDCSFGPRPARCRHLPRWMALGTLRPRPSLIHWVVNTSASTACTAGRHQVPLVGSAVPRWLGTCMVFTGLGHDPTSRSPGTVASGRLSLASSQTGPARLQRVGLFHASATGFPRP
jgi:hypothetical protein